MFDFAKKGLLGLSITGVSTEMMVMKKENNVRILLDEMIENIQNAIEEYEAEKAFVENCDCKPKRRYDNTQQMKHEIYNDIAFAGEMPISIIHNLMSKYGCSNPSLYMTRWMESDGRVTKEGRCYVWVVE